MRDSGVSSASTTACRLLTRHEVASTGHDVPNGFLREKTLSLQSEGRDTPSSAPCNTIVGTMIGGRVARWRSTPRSAGRWGIAMAMAVGVDHDGHEIGIIEGRGRAVEGGVVETPGR